ncbi:hypothetical protein SCLCIDRAFT_123251, partial [Scleroderma citrinum Foug A]
SQGQTILHIIVDIANLPTGGLSLFNLYVLLAAHSAELIAEDDRLRELDTETKKQWELMGWGPTALMHR